MSDKFESLKTGHVEIDKHHRVIFEAIERSHTAVKEQNKEEFGTNLEFLIAYTKIHFEMEDDLMIKSRYLDIERHRKIHTFLIEQLVGIDQKFKAGNLKLNPLLMGFLSDWLENHIKGEDAKLVKHLKYFNCSQ